MFFLIDKPIGMSSFEALKKIRKTLGIKKIGHGGTLDPLATGCMIIATEKSTKLLSLLDHASKEYIFTVKLDGKSDSLDWGTPIKKEEYRRNNKTWEELEEYILSQKEQIPPNYSALHIDGVRAYTLARAGKEFEIKKRPIEVLSIKVVSESESEITLHIHLSSGGYVRSFAPIIGEFLWSKWGYISSLRRTSIHTQYGSWWEKDMSSLDSPKEKEYKHIFSAIPQKEISKEIYEQLILGKRIETTWEKIEEGSFVFFNFKNQYMSLVQYTKNIFTIIRNDVL